MTTSAGALSSDAFSSDAFSFNINSFALWLVQPEPLWIRLWLWSCTLEQMFSISNWQFLIPCYHQNLEGDFAKHPLFQQAPPGTKKVFNPSLMHSQHAIRLISFDLSSENPIPLPFFCKCCKS